MTKRPGGFGVVAGLVALAMSGWAAPAGAVVIADWTFEAGGGPSTAGPIAADVGAGTVSGSHASPLTVYSAPSGNGSAHSYSSNHWAIGDYYEFHFSTLGLDNIHLSWDQASSAVGPGDFSLQYSTDGVNFTDVFSYKPVKNAPPNPQVNPTTAFSLYTLAADLSGIAAINNRPDVFLRMTDVSNVSAQGGLIGIGGTSRLDNILITSTPEPATAALSLAGLGTLALRLARRRGRNRLR